MVELLQKRMETVTEENSHMDDILYLLHLESLKRFTEEAKDVHRQVDEQVRIYEDAKREYRREFIRLANLSKPAMLCEVLDTTNAHIDDTQVDRTATELSKSNSIISSDMRPTKLDVHTLKECKMQLQTKHRPRDLLAKHQKNFAENLETLKAACTTLDNVENNFETATLVAMDQFTSELQAPQKNAE